MSLHTLLNPKGMTDAPWLEIYVNSLHTNAIQFGLSSTVGNVVSAIDTAGNLGLVNIGGTGPFSQVGTTRKLTGSANGSNYTFTTTGAAVPYTAIDATNLNSTIVVPVGFKLVVKARLQTVNSTGNKDGYGIAIVDSVGTTALDAWSQNGGTFPSTQEIYLHGVVNGDGASHTISLQYALSSTSGTNGVLIGNQPISTTAVFGSSSANTPIMILSLVQSN